jgi:hypothetical protein
VAFNEANKLEVQERVEAMRLELPLMAKALIGEHLDLKVPENQAFYENPDNPLFHAPSWHQWGIITHTNQFSSSFSGEVLEHAKKWGLTQAVGRLFAEQVDGLDKRQLMEAGVLFHDLGKFTKRTVEYDAQGKPSYKFEGHEVDSGRLIRKPDFVAQMYTKYGLNANHVEYIARCAELHFVLGTLREEAKSRAEALPYSIELIQSDWFRDRARQIANSHPGYELEIGLMFLGDSLAKTDIRLQAETDAELELQKGVAERIVVERQLHPKLARGVMQVPLNTAAAKSYLQTVVELL